MQKVVAIITEYNPFHNGHKYQIDKIREENNEAIIIAIMSGNVVQRGELAIADKYSRAEMAIKCGVDAVFELPYPYSGSCAEIFAYGGVSLAHSLGAEILYFGTETDNIENLERIADVVDSEIFDTIIKNIPNYNEYSYPILKQKALEKLGFDISIGSNDILAIEYIRQIKKQKYSLKYKSIQRVGASYNDEATSDLMSATGIRKAFNENNEFISMPAEALEIINREKKNGKLLDLNNVQNMLHNYAVMISPKEIEKSFDCQEGMGYFISKKAKEAKNSSEFFELLTSKSFTTSRLKRTLLYSFFGVKKISKITKSYTVLLATNKRGKMLLKQNKINRKLTILTKHSDSKKLTKKLLPTYILSKKTDEIYQMLLHIPNPAESAYKYKPIIM